LQLSEKWRKTIFRKYTPFIDTNKMENSMM